MPKLPDVTALGGRPTPRATRGVGNATAVGRGVQQAANIEANAAGRVGQGGAAIAQGLNEAGQTVDVVLTRIQKRENAISRLNSITKYNEDTTQDILAAETTGDLSNKKQVKELNEKIRTRIQDVIEAHKVEGGSPDSVVALTQALEEDRSRYFGQIASISINTLNKKLKIYYQSSLNLFSSAVRENPSSQNLAVQRQNFRKNIARVGDGIGQANINALIFSADSVLGEVSVESTLLREGPAPARERLRDEPGLLGSIHTNAQTRLYDKIRSVEQQVNAGAKKGLAIVAELTAALGRPPTEQEILRKEGAAPPRPLVEISNVGETAFAKELGEQDAERISELQDNAQTAFRNRAEIDRMSAALESGKFATGVFADARQFLARLATFVGASEDTQALIGDAATADVLDAASKNLAVEMAQKLGRITNMSLGFVIDSLPALTRTPEGNKILLEVMGRTATREIELANLGDRYAREFGTLRPEGEASFFQAMRDLEESDPVITEELRKRIIGGSKKAPKSFMEVFGGEKPDKLELPEGYEFVRMENGKAIIRDSAGNEFVQE